ALRFAAHGKVFAAKTDFIGPCGLVLAPNPLGRLSESARAEQGRSVCRLQEGEDLLVFLSGQVRADAHVQHHYFPLCVAVGIGRADVVTVAAVLRPKNGPARASNGGVLRSGLARPASACRSGSGAACQEEGESGEDERGASREESAYFPVHRLARFVRSQ